MPDAALINTTFDPRPELACALAAEPRQPGRRRQHRLAGSLLTPDPVVPQIDPATASRDELLAAARPIILDRGARWFREQVLNRRKAAGLAELSDAALREIVVPLRTRRRPA